MWEGIGKRGQKIDDCNKLYGLGGPLGGLLQRENLVRDSAQKRKYA